MARMAGAMANPPGIWRRRFNDLTSAWINLRRLAFLAEAFDRAVPTTWRASHRATGPALGRLEDARVVVTIAHWRAAQRGGLWDDDEVLLTCVRRLLAMPTASMHVIILTNDGPATDRVLAEGSARGQGPLADVMVQHDGWERRLGQDGPNVTVLQPRLRWPRHSGLYLTWAHKRVLRRALLEPTVTHLVYLEDDIGLTEDNLRYWIRTRPALEPIGLIPGFLLFESHTDQRFLIQQTAPGQRSTVCESLDVPGLGTVSLVRAELPYHASYVMDRALASDHFTRSALRSPFRSRVAGWGVRERAAAGPVFGPSSTPLKNVVRIGSAPPLPPARNAVPIRRSDDGSGTPRVVEGALLEHLRPTYSTAPDVASGKLPVEDF